MNIPNSERAHGQFIIEAPKGVPAEQVRDLIVRLAKLNGNIAALKQKIIKDYSAVDSELFDKCAQFVTILKAQETLIKDQTGKPFNIFCPNLEKRTIDEYEAGLLLERDEVASDFATQNNGRAWRELADEVLIERKLLSRVEIPEAELETARKRPYRIEKGDDGKHYQLVYDVQYLEATVGVANGTSFWTYQGGVAEKSGSSAGAIAGSATSIMPPSLPENFAILPVSWTQIGDTAMDKHGNLLSGPGGFLTFPSEDTAFAQSLVRALSVTGLAFGYGVSKSRYPSEPGEFDGRRRLKHATYSMGNM